jgi:putative PIG3 family NAD(P)H quinone oxidoreductase
MSPITTAIDLPTTMKAIKIREPGGPEVLEPQTVPMPVPGQGEVLVRVAAAGVNRGDIVQRLGFYPAPKGVTDTPGLEFAGEVVALGPGANDLKIGDKVCALVAGGGYAQYATVHQSHVLPVPDGYSMVDAAALPETTMTVWTNVFDRGGLKPGETLLIHGGTSGIGTTAIQMAVAHGAKVFATAGSDKKARKCEELGARRGINYKTEDFVMVMDEMTGGTGADVIFDMVGGEYIQRNITCAARGGRIVNIAYQQGSVAEVNFLPLMLKQITLTGSTLRARALEEKTALTETVRSQVWPWIAAGRLKPIVDSTFPMNDAKAAHEHMETSAHIGKIILTM